MFLHTKNRFPVAHGITAHRVPSPLESLKSTGLYHKKPPRSLHFTAHQWSWESIPQAKPFICSQQVWLRLLNSWWWYLCLGTDQRPSTVPQSAGQKPSTWPRAQAAMFKRI